MKELFLFLSFFFGPRTVEKHCTLTPNQAQPYDSLHPSPCISSSLLYPHFTHWPKRLQTLVPQPISLQHLLLLTLLILQQLNGFKHACPKSSYFRNQTHTLLNTSSPRHLPTKSSPRERRKSLSVSHISRKRTNCINVGLKDHQRSGADGLS